MLSVKALPLHLNSTLVITEDFALLIPMAADTNLNSTLVTTEGRIRDGISLRMRYLNSTVVTTEVAACELKGVNN